MTLSTTLGTALVTGASAGIGGTYADRLARRGHDLVLVARDGARLSALADTLKAKYGVAVDVLRADLSVPQEVRTVERRLREDEAITFLVNNAGIGPKGALLADDIDYLDTMIALNVTAANRLAVAAAQAFATRGAGTIVNLASAVAIMPELFNGAYSGTKAYVLAFTQSLARELEGTGVRLQAVLPGLTRTEFFDRVGSSADNYDQKNVMDVAHLVDAALAGLDKGELVTIPSLPDVVDWERFEAARQALGPNISHDRPAARYAV